ncbi:MAG: 23S rRNA (adenine(2030)-N(6))-methyltransferase RlmJ [Alphaproteobacteria bacterium]|nr:23S rRNA (adenine(2030)-N(6))-methyltransferase RlmJ [Alphaproteobacteria bacterium]
MNYRHLYHAGNVADLFKHAVLLLLIQRYLVKDKPFLLLDSHAGAGLYDVTSAEAQKTAEAQLGFVKLARAHHLPPLFARICDVARQISAQFGASAAQDSLPKPQNHLQFYPGSAILAGLGKRPIDRLILCEKHPEECQKLRQNLRRFGLANLAIHERDGYEALRAFLPPPEQRGVIFIDPPYESPSEEHDCVNAVKFGLTKFPQGCFVAWYPIKNRVFAQRFLAEFKNLPAKSILDVAIEHGDLTPPVKKSPKPAENSGKIREALIGSGMVIINPPWQIEGEIQALGQALLTILGLPKGGVTAQWLISENLGQ